MIWQYGPQTHHSTVGGALTSLRHGCIEARLVRFVVDDQRRDTGHTDFRKQFRQVGQSSEVLQNRNKDSFAAFRWNIAFPSFLENVFDTLASCIIIIGIGELKPTPRAGRIVELQISPETVRGLSQERI